MSSPSSRIRPALGESTPVSRLMRVVLPAPLGPMSAWRAPRSTLSDTSVQAEMPPKFLCSPAVSSATGMSAAFPEHAAQPRRDALAPDQHDRDQQQPDPELPVLRRERGEPVLHQLEGDGA